MLCSRFGERTCALAILPGSKRGRPTLDASFPGGIPSRLTTAGFGERGVWVKAKRRLGRGPVRKNYVLSARQVKARGGTAIVNAASIGRADQSG
jgi:hypothetical protein